MGDDFFMSLAINKAWQWQILTYPNPAVGCVIVDRNGKILSIKSHKKAGFLHAEALGILFALFAISSDFLQDFLQKYNFKFSSNFSSIDELDKADLNATFCYDFILQNHSNLLNGAKAYVTLEPCSHKGKTPSCAVLLKDLNFSEVIIAKTDLNAVASGGAGVLKNSGISVKFGILEEEAGELLRPFLIWQKRNFSFFKLSLSANGVAKGAKGSITNLQSQTHAHCLRSISQLLVTGGETIRTDRPILDSRLSGGKATDLVIYSRNNNFDMDIPAFNIPNRNVKIVSNLELADSNLTMFEGGENLLEAVKNKIDMFLIYRSSKFLNETNVKLELSLKPLFCGNFGDDSYTWYRQI